MMKKKLVAGIICSLLVGSVGIVPNPIVKEPVRVSAAQTLSKKGTIMCANEETLQYTFVDGVLTISGKGDRIVEENPFAQNDKIKKVVFSKDCQLVYMDYMFSNCRNLETVENIPETVLYMPYTFECTALKSIPKLPPELENLKATFFGCKNIKTVDFSKLPNTITNFEMAFSRTSLRQVDFTLKGVGEVWKDNMKHIAMAYCFSKCPYLKSVTIDASQEKNKLWLQGICENAVALETFELKMAKEQNEEESISCTSSMFENCTNLKAVYFEGKSNFLVKNMFSGCKQLQTVQCNQFSELYFNQFVSLENMFKDCSSLEGTFYMKEGTLYEKADMETILENEDKFKYAFSGCTDKVTFYIDNQALVDYYNGLKESGEADFTANIQYFEGEIPKTTLLPIDSYKPEIKDEVEEIPEENKPQTTVAITPVPPSKKPQKKIFNNFKVTSCKKNAKVIKGKVVKGAKITTKIAGKKYSVIADKKGSFTIKLKKKLKAKTTVTITATKSGYLKKQIKIILK